MSARVSSRARSREDRGGDPLDGLVNLFDLGIVLAVAFLLAALSSINLTPDVLQGKTASNQSQTVQVPADSILLNRDEKLKRIEIEPGQTVSGRGEKIGTVYKLKDGRTVIVEQPGAASGK